MNALHIYKSSAGSGKTYTLVKEYLKIVLQKPSAFRHTLAITFTNKATAEMKERIVSGLVDLTENKDPELKIVLELEINNPGIDISERAEMVLKLVLHDYSNFGISTIDSFFSRIIRSLAKEMQLPLKFEMEMNEDYISSRLTEMLISDVGKSEILTQWLQQFVFDKMKDEKGWNIDKEIKTVAKEVFKHPKQEPNDERKITLDFIRQLQKIKYDYIANMRLFGKEFLAILESESLNIGDIAYGKSGVANYFLKIYEGQKGSDWIPGKRPLEAIESPENWATKNSPKRNEIINLAEHNFIPLLNRTLDFHNANFKNYASSCEVLSLAYMAGILSYLQEKMNTYRDENDVLLMSDTNKLLKNFITGNDTPFIYEKTGNTYQNYLIDEFQDTSDLQWDNLLPLILNGLGTGGMAMMVGDAKQSIYRWRGGNSKLLLENINLDLNSFSSIKTDFNLDTNYRSYKEVVDFNNTFFSLAPPLLELSDPALLKLAYFEKDTIQKNIKSKSEGGYVSISLFPRKEKADEGEENRWKDVALKNMTDTIHRLQELGYDLQDIAILVRQNKDGQTIADYLFAHGFKKISSADSLKLHTAPQIGFLIRILTFLAWPDNKPALAEVMYYYQKYILKNVTVENHDIFCASGSSSKGKKYDYLPENWYKQKENLATLPLYELIERLIDLFNLNSIPDAYIQRFQDMILDYSSKNKPGIKNFLDWWDDHKESENLNVITSKDKDAINIVSIHKSKGLQYPVILVPLADGSFVPKADSLLWITSDEKPYDQVELFPVKTSKILAETHFAADYKEETDQTFLDNLNMLYVAFTRAEEKLVVFSVYNDSENKTISSVSQLLTFVLNQHEPWQSKLRKDADALFFETGEMASKAKKIKSESPPDFSFDKPGNLSLSDYPFNLWQEKINVRVSRNFSVTNDEDQSLTAIDFGLLLHEMMSYIKNTADKEKALKKIVDNHLLSIKESKQLTTELDLVFSLTEQENWFTNDWHILNESEIADPEGNLMRPDRVMIKDKSAVVLDYKTGQPEDKHHSQIAGYAVALERMGFSDVKAYLLYLQDKKLVPVIG